MYQSCRWHVLGGVEMACWKWRVGNVTILHGCVSNAPRKTYAARLLGAAARTTVVWQTWRAFSQEYLSWKVVLLALLGGFLQEILEVWGVSLDPIKAKQGVEMYR